MSFAANSSFLAVIEPISFDMNQLKALFEKFAFVFTTPNHFVREQFVQLIHEVYKLRKHKITPKLYRSIIDRMKEVLNCPGLDCDLKNLLELIILFFDLTCYNASSCDKDVHLRLFTIVTNLGTVYYLFVGSEDWSVDEIIEKIKQKWEWNNTHPCRKSFITVIELQN